MSCKKPEAWGRCGKRRQQDVEREMSQTSRTIPIQVEKTAEKVHQAMELRIGALPKACYKGCGTCCHQIVDVLNWEESLVIGFLRREMPTKQKLQVRANLKSWFSAFNGATRPANRDTPLSLAEISAVRAVFRQRRIACPFLLNNQCSIYRVRPVVCRSHIVPDNPQECFDDPGRVGTQLARNIAREEVRAFDPAVYPLSGMPLPYLVAHELKAQVEIRPLVAPVRGAGPAAAGGV